MKKYLLFLLLLFIIPSLSATVEITNYVNDYANILTADEIQNITSQLQALEASGKAQMAVVIIPSLEGRDIEGYAFELANDKLGSKETNNGLLLLISITDRKYRFEVGRGL